MAPASKPTAAELEILAVLWEQGPSTVRQVYDALAARRDTGYTTVLKLMQIMAEKGLVSRDESVRAHRYQAQRPRQETQRQLLADLIDKAFSGSPALLVQQALSMRRASGAEIAEIRRLLDETSTTKTRKRTK
ncbi:MAG: BlaI/MecI/CopY family transcriptional regulator [Bryobacteraceae bacterium]